MKLNFSMAFLCLSIILLLFSCEKDNEFQQTQKQITTTDDQSKLRSINDRSNFFDIHYLFNSLRLESNMSGYVSGVGEIVDYYSTKDLEDSSIDELEAKDIWPCWYCTEADHFDALNYYTPLYNINSKDFEGLLLTRKRDQKLMSALITTNLASAMATTSNNDLPLYIDRVMEYFEGGVAGKGIKDYTSSKKIPCTLSEASGWCVCDNNNTDCTDNDASHVGGTKCLPGCGNIGSGGNDDPPNEDPYSDDDGDDSSGPGSCFFCGTYSVNGSNETNGPGSTPPDSQFDIIERQEIVTSILEYIDQNTSIYINLGNILALSNETHFDYTTYLLYNNMATMTEAQIEAYLQLITVHRHFITDATMSNILLFDSGLCNGLNDFLTSNSSSDISYKYGRVITILSQENSWSNLITNSQSLMDLEAFNSLLSFTDTEIEHILTFEAGLIADIQDFIDDHSNDPLAIEIIHDFIDLQQCDAPNPCVHTNYNNELEAIFSFLNSLSSQSKNWLNQPINKLHKEMIWKNVINYSGDADAQEFINDHFNQLQTNAEYKAFVESTFGWSGIMWSIAKELIGDKAVDLAFQLIPGFGQADKIRDAFKAAKNGDWLEFFVETGKIVAKETPWGKWIKTLDIANDLLIYYKKVEKIWDKIEGFAENVIEQMWNIIKQYPASLRTNTDLIGGIAKTIKRGLKSIDDVMASIPNFTQMSSNRMKHILHGDGTGGLHHVSGLVNDPSKKVIDILSPNTKGVYRIKLEGSNDWKTMFPDSKSEIGVAKSIEFVFNNKVSDEFIGNGKRLIKGFDNANIPIEIITDSSYNIISAFPKYIL